MDFVPSNIIKTPDFGAMAQNAMQRKRQDIKEMNSWIDSNEKKEGAYLEGDKPAVQEAWNAYQEQLDKYVESESPEAKRAADEAYGSYVQLAGTALANAEQYRNQVAAFKADPSKFSVSGQDFMNMTNEYRTSRRSADDIMEAVQNPFVIPQSMTYDLSNPVTQSQKMLQMSSAKLSDFYDEKGNLNTASARAYAESLAESIINANESSVEKAMAWGGVREGFAGGEDGIINSMEELEFLRSQPEEKRQQFVEKYKEELVKDYMNLLPTNKKAKKDDKTLSLQSYDVELPTSDTDKPQSTTFQAFAKPLTGPLRGIVGFGQNPAGEFLVQEVSEVEVRDPNDPTQKIKEKRRSIRKAAPDEIAQIQNVLKRDYGMSMAEPEEDAAPPLPTQAAEEAPATPEPTAETPAEEAPATPQVEDDVLGLFTDEEAPAEEPKKKTEGNVVSSKKDEGENPNAEGDYVVVNGRAYFKKDYDRVAGKRTNKGNYPETFEDYAKKMGVEILNTKERPLTNMLDEVTVIDGGQPAVQREDVEAQQAGVSRSIRNEEEAAVDETQESLNSETFYEELLGAEGGISTDTKDVAAKKKGNQDAPKTVVDGKEVLQHTNKGVTYEVFKDWAKENNIKKKDYHERFLNLTDREVMNIVDDYTRDAGADNFESPVLRALFTQNKWGTGNVIAGDLKEGRSDDFRALINWIEENTGIKFKGDPKTRTIESFTPEQAQAIEEFYNKDPEAFIKGYTEKKKTYYKTLDTYKVHGRGWDRRANDLEKALLKQIT